jgi:hypothetical protein
MFVLTISLLNVMPGHREEKSLHLEVIHLFSSTGLNNPLLSPPELTAALRHGEFRQTVGLE